MVEHSESSLSETGRGRVIDWAAVGTLAIEWLLAVGQYVFVVLLLGLVGGYLGTFVDGGLSLLREEWGGRGREWGWVLGAVLAAIGLPLGWIERDGKKFSFPSPRQLRKTVAAGIQPRRRKKTKTYDYRRIRDIFVGGGLLGILGAVLGLVLGLVLLMAWFSLTMSPFSPAGWLESIEFNAKIEHTAHALQHDEPRRVAMRSDHPLLIYLVAWPVLVLGSLGLVVGVVNATARYLGYLWSVPAGRRASARGKARKPMVQEREATAAAIEQRLPVLASPPRRVPRRARWHLLRGEVHGGLVGGGSFAALGTVVTLAFVLVWWFKPDEMPLIVITLPLLFAGFGVLFASASLQIWQRQINILRRGYLARCRILECKDPQTEQWKPYETALEELRAVWDKPIASIPKQLITRYNLSLFGMGWEKTVVHSDTKSFPPFMRLIGWFIWMFFGFMAIVGVGLTLAVIYVAIVEEPLAWFGLLFVAVWWVVIVLLGRSLFAKVRLLKNIENLTLGDLGVEPLFDCRAQLTLPYGKTVDFKTKIDLSHHLTLTTDKCGDVAVYDPYKPSQAIHLSYFRPPLTVDESGQWQSAHPNVFTIAQPDS
ncbi:MAG: hypothetical protein WD738_03245 [Pirellulales bacterium]